MVNFWLRNMVTSQDQTWEILTEIEFAIVDGELENDRQAIYAYLRERKWVILSLKNYKSVGDKTVFMIFPIIHDLDRIGLIGVNGTGKTTLFRRPFLAFLALIDVSPFSAKEWL